jgi:hypothetical protein
VKKHLSLSITQYHRELWYPMPLTFLIISMLSVFPDYSIIGIGHMTNMAHMYEREKPDICSKIKVLTEKTREYNEKFYPGLCSIFKEIRVLKEFNTDTDIQKYIDDMMSVI